MDVDILINGKSVKQHAHENKLFVEAKEGSEYVIKVKNNGISRRLIVCSVDGINVINGEAAGASKAGYIIQGSSSFEIKGFRVSNDAVNAFKFNKKDKSYAAKSEATGGDTSNCGIIGVEVYEEKEKPKPKVVEHHHHHYPKVDKTPWIFPKPCPYNPIPWEYPKYPEIIWTCNTNNSPNYRMVDTVTTCEATSSGPITLNYSNTSENPSDGMDMLKCSITQDASFDMGTEFSKNEIKDTVTEVAFEIGRLLTTIEIYYASRQSLINMGVQIIKENQVVLPKAFPTKFCKPPVN